MFQILFPLLCIKYIFVCFYRSVGFEGNDLLQKSYSDLNTLVEQYDRTLLSILDKHAPEIPRYSGRLLYVHRPHGTLKRLQMRKTKDLDWKGNGGNPKCSLTVNAMCISVMLSTT